MNSLPSMDRHIQQTNDRLLCIKQVSVPIRHWAWHELYVNTLQLYDIKHVDTMNWNQTLSKQALVLTQPVLYISLFCPNNMHHVSGLRLQPSLKTFHKYSSGAGTHVPGYLKWCCVSFPIARVKIGLQNGTRDEIWGSCSVPPPTPS